MKYRTDEELFDLIVAGDKKAREEFIIKHRGLVGAVLNQHFPLTKKKDWEDYYSIGLVGLMEGLDDLVKRRDKTIDIKLTTYIGVCIKNKIRVYIKKCKVDRGKLGISIDRPKSTESDDERTLLHKLKAPNDDFDNLFEESENKELVAKIKSIIEYKLTDKEARVILARYFTNGELIEQKALAKELGVSQTLISARELTALQKIRKELGVKKQLTNYDKNIKIDKLPKDFCERLGGEVDIAELENAMLTALTSLQRQAILLCYFTYDTPPSHQKVGKLLGKDGDRCDRILGKGFNNLRKALNIQVEKNKPNEVEFDAIPVEFAEKLGDVKFIQSQVGFIKNVINYKLSAPRARHLQARYFSPEGVRKQKEVAQILGNDTTSCSHMEMASIAIIKSELALLESEG